MFNKHFTSGCNTDFYNSPETQNRLRCTPKYQKKPKKKQAK